MRNKKEIHEFVLKIIKSQIDKDIYFIKQPFYMCKDMFGLYYIVFANKTPDIIEVYSEMVATNCISAFFQRRKYFKF